MSQIITNAFSRYWQECLTNQTPVVLDEFVLANVPDLDPAAPIDPDSGLPPAGQIVHRHKVDQRGRINNDAVAYTIVMDTTVGDFGFNAMYLINKATGMVGMIVHKGMETKLKTDEAAGQTGNSLVKSMLMEYDRAAEATATHVDASTWQIDYAARLRGMDDDLRLQALQFFGPATFYGDGFNLVNASGVYKVQPGVAYVGGLRAELNEVKKITPGAKPVGLWLDIYRAGSLLDAWVNHFTLTLSVPDMVDYLDSNGYQHHVAKVAIINADGSVTDVRRKRTIELTGDVAGKGIIEDGSAVIISVDVKDNSHSHTKDQVGLGSVNNWGATSAVNDASDVKYATAGAVKKTYDLAAAALPKAGGVVEGDLTVKGTMTGSGNNPFSVAKAPIGQYGALIKGEVEPGGWQDWGARSTGLSISCPSPENSAYSVWRATKWGSYHIAGMDVHVPNGEVSKARVDLHLGGGVSRHCWDAAGYASQGSISAGNGVFDRGNLVFSPLNKPIGLSAGWVLHGNVIPLPAGFTQAQCAWLVSPRDIYMTEVSAPYSYRLTCYVNENRQMIAYGSTDDGGGNGNPGAGNFIVIGIK
ncbi:TPA: phage tail protein [Aeromonas veronii]